MSVRSIAFRFWPLWLSLSCARQPASWPIIDRSICEIAGLGAGNDSVTVLLGEPIDPANAPVPTNDAEALVFRQLYQTLVMLDCKGGVAVPGLATAWRDQGTRWTFALRPGAGFQDGSPLDATAIFEGWRAIDTNTVVTGVHSDGTTLTVYLSQPRPVTFFADPALRVVRRVGESVWPLGTSPWTLAPDSQVPGTITLNAGPRGMIRFEYRPVGDDRDLLDAGTAILVTRTPATVAYATSLPGWTATPLFWNRSYVLLAAHATRPDPAGLATARSDLARDVVRGEARPAAREVDDWLTGCLSWPGTPPADRAPAVRRRVVYPRHDPVARRVAERLVARAESDLSILLGTPLAPGGTITAAGLSPAGLDSALLERDDWAVVVPVFPTSGMSCAPVSRLGRGWGTVIPLVDTRAHALVRGVPRVWHDRDGLVIEPPPRRR